MEISEAKREASLPIDEGAFAAARQDIHIGRAGDPEYVRHRFKTILKENRNLAMEIIRSAHTVAESRAPADVAFIEGVVTVFDAIAKTESGKVLAAEAEITPAA